MRNDVLDFGMSYVNTWERVLNFMFSVTSSEDVLPCPVEINPIKHESDIHTVAVHAL